MEEVRKANDEYLSRMARFGELENQMRENLKNSTRCMERFKSEKGMSDEEFESFLDRVYQTVKSFGEDKMPLSIV